MAYVPGFQHDLFVSYGSEDYDAQMGRFVADLRVYLARELGKLFKGESVFFDRQNLNHTPTEWKTKLEESAGSAAILVPFLSASYATSEYCAKELEWFCENHDRPLNWPAGTEKVYRICPLRWRATDEQVAPEVRAAQEQQSIGVEDLGAKIANGLRLMRRSCQTVYVGETDNEVRGKVRDELGRMGFRVMPDLPTAYRDSQLVRTHLSEARLAIHFVDGRAPQRAIDSIRWSREHCQRATVIYEVLGCDIKPAERLQLRWIEEDLRQATTLDQRAYDHVSGKNFDQFLQVVRDRLERVLPVRPTPLGIACEERDRPAVEDILTEIRVQTGFTVTCHGLSLLDFKKSRGVLFYWGAADGRRLRQARVATKGIRQAFFLAPPPKEAEHERELGEEVGENLIFRQHSARFKVDDIAPFLRELGWVG
ncbi:MAG TPA: toll/interleukin-1 receptor domain-containing protein [Candidatus Angelobacter sp.]|nr:toll/interleukin-1 receptor domain-containing protein [Candidatus Angelobacter sp.]